MAIYVLGDPHLSFSADKPMDIFGSCWQDHPEKIKRAWEKMVKADDTVILAGDLSWAMSLKDAEPDLRFFHDLPGRKVLLKGNHDYWWETVSKMNRFFEERKWDDFQILYNNSILCENIAVCGTRGWEAESTGEQDRKILQREVQRLELSLQSAPADRERVVILHYPPFDGEHAPFEELFKKYGVKRCYYGHIHGRAARESVPIEKDGVLYTLISADALDFTPLLIASSAGSKQNHQKKPGFWAKVLSYFKGLC